MATDGLFLNEEWARPEALGKFDPNYVDDDLKKAAEANYKKQKDAFGVVNADTIALQKKKDESEIEARKPKNYTGSAAQTLLGNPVTASTPVDTSSARMTLMGA